MLLCVLRGESHIKLFSLSKLIVSRISEISASWVGEIRKLAEISSRQVVKISDNLQGIKSLISTSQESVNHAHEQFDRMVSLIDTVQSEELSIQDAMNVQASGRSDIINALNEMNTLIEKIEATSRSLLVSGESVIQHIRMLKTL